MSDIFYYFVVMSAVSVYITDCGLHLVPERANVSYFNEKFFHNYTFAVKRYSRKGDYYINIEYSTKHMWINNVSLSFIFNEFLHNEYRRSFVELHYKYCNLLRDEKYFAPALMKYNLTCPLPVALNGISDWQTVNPSSRDVIVDRKVSLILDTDYANIICSIVMSPDDFCRVLTTEVSDILPVAVKQSGTYRLINLTIPLDSFPSVFPFERARLDIEYNHTITKEPMAKLHLYCTLKNLRV